MVDSEKNKISKEDMMEEIKEELLSYFRKGLINTSSFFQFDDGVDEIKFQNINDILKIHFMLSSKVREYILTLEKNIRNIKNSTKVSKRTFRGEVRGNIDWDQTIRNRTNMSYGDKTIFVCDNIDKLYDIKENLILKRAIEIIYNIIYVDVGMDRFIKKDWYLKGGEISKIIWNIYKKNIYIKRIDISNVEITDKMIFDVSKSRNKIYRDSAEIVKLYRNILNLEEEEISKLFKETFINIQDENKVFELYSIIKYLRENFPHKKTKYNVLDGRQDCLAKIDSEQFSYEIFHDSVGDSDINFSINKKDIENSGNMYLERKIKILSKKNSILKEFNKAESNSVWRGRPDLLIIKRNKSNFKISEIVIGEIKYTNSENYMFIGLEELLEYIYLIRDINGQYINDIPIKGLLFVDNIALERTNFKDIHIIAQGR